MNERNELALTSSATYNVYIRKFNSFLDGRKCSAEVLREYFTTIRKDAKPSTVACIKSAIKKSIVCTMKKESRDLLFLSSLELLFKEFKTGKTDIRVYREKVLSPKEIRTIEKKVSVKEALIIRTLAMTGLRISELTGMKIQDCVIDGDIVYVQVLGKGSKLRRIFLPVALYTQIRSVFNGKTFLFETRNNGRYDRSYVWRIVRRDGQSIIGRHISPHTFRHSFATNMLLEEKKSLKAVSLYLGHSSTSVTSDMYVHDELRPSDLFRIDVTRV